jgi:hypothetical protein
MFKQLTIGEALEPELVNVLDFMAEQLPAKRGANILIEENAQLSSLVKEAVKTF